LEDVISDIQPRYNQYMNLVVSNRPNLLPGIDIKEALKIYKSFHLLQKASAWGDVLVQCTCCECFKNCVCAHNILFTSLLDEKLRVKEEYIAATVGLTAQAGQQPKPASQGGEGGLTAEERRLLQRVSLQGGRASQSEARPASQASSYQVFQLHKKFLNFHHYRLAKKPSDTILVAATGYADEIRGRNFL
jgi:hypothetical protein